MGTRSFKHYKTSGVLLHLLIVALCLFRPINADKPNEKGSEAKSPEAKGLEAKGLEAKGLEAKGLEEIQLSKDQLDMQFAEIPRIALKGGSSLGVDSMANDTLEKVANDAIEFVKKMGATKEEIKKEATKKEATKEETKKEATKEETKKEATKEETKKEATKEETLAKIPEKKVPEKVQLSKDQLDMQFAEIPRIALKDDPSFGIDSMVNDVLEKVANDATEFVKKMGATKEEIKKDAIKKDATKEATKEETTKKEAPVNIPEKVQLSKDQLDMQFAEIPGVTLHGNPSLDADFVTNNTVEKVANDATELIRKMEAHKDTKKEKVVAKKEETVAKIAEAKKQEEFQLTKDQVDMQFVDIPGIALNKDPSSDVDSIGNDALEKVANDATEFIKKISPPKTAKEEIKKEAIKEGIKKEAIKNESPAKVSEVKKPEKVQLSKDQLDMQFAEIPGIALKDDPSFGIDSMVNDVLEKVANDATEFVKKMGATKEEIKKEATKETTKKEAPVNIPEKVQLSKDQLDMQFAEIPGIALHGNPSLDADFVTNDAIEKVANDATKFIQKMETHKDTKKEEAAIKTEKVIGKSSEAKKQEKVQLTKDQLDVQFAEIPGIALHDNPSLGIESMANDALEKVANDATEFIKKMGHSKDVKIPEKAQLTKDQLDMQFAEIPGIALHDNPSLDIDSMTNGVLEKIANDATEFIKKMEPPKKKVADDKASKEKEKETIAKISEEKKQESSKDTKAEGFKLDGSIAEHIANKIAEELAPEEPLIDDQEISLSTTASSEKTTLLTGISTSVVTASGTTTVVLSTVTFEPAYTKIRRCIYGCRVLAMERGPEKADVTVTALPVTLPCSLVVCPPCGCTTRVVNLTGCPVIVTETPPDSYVFLTLDTTITFITVTTTISSCTATTCLTPITVTITTTSGPGGVTTITQFSTLKPTTVTRFSTQKIFSTPAVIIPDGCCPVDYDYDGRVDPPEGCLCGTSIIPPDCPCQAQQEECDCGSSHEEMLVMQIPGCADGNCPFHNFKAEEAKDEAGAKSADNTKKKKTCKKCSPKKPKSGCSGSCPTNAVGSYPTGHSIAPTTGATATITGSVCTTFVVCNPAQFNCPAQVTGGAQFASFLKSWDLAPNKIPGGFPYAYLAGGIPQAGMEYLGYDGSMHGMGVGSVAGRNGTEPVSASSESATTTQSSATAMKDSRMKAASKNNALVRLGLFPLIMLPTALIYLFVQLI